MPGPVQEIHYSAAPGAWRLYRAEPCAELRGVVVEYWEVVGTLEPFRETLLPNGCVELMINLGPPHRVLSDAGAGNWEHGWFSGLHERAIVIESLAGTHLLSARVHPLGAATLFGNRTASAANDIIDLHAFLGAPYSLLQSGIGAAASPADRFAVLERFLVDLLPDAEPIPAFVTTAAERIDAAGGNLKVATLNEELNVSRKHLAVMFERHLGMSLKAYAKIRRFVSTLKRIQESEEISWSTLAIDAGYSDQSHLGRDFQRVGAATPGEYLRRRAPDGSALLYDAD